ncbi:MAG: DNA internalization-related competence protein ComEC/Rec2 [Paraburkholderia sp.]|nr:MAG: DNA internalization-related competence protein ComEC/Rec2 [Paraburkholderia sp.]
MRGVLIGFTLGVVMLQQRASLPGRWEWAALGLLFAALLSVTARAWASAPAIERFARDGRSMRVRALFERVAALAPRMAPAALAGAAVVAGHAYAAMRAELRLAQALPLAWEQRALTLSGHVRGLPVGDRSNTRFLFAVDVDEVRQRTGIERFPAVVQLNWRGGSPAPPLAPGDRFRLTVRLKRPHGYANFAGQDTEVSLLERGVRATGAVAPAAVAIRLPGTAGGVGTAIDRVRFALRERIEQALADARHRGIVAALAIGTQDAIADDDRIALRRTGTSHLVAVSGLHIGFVAGLCAMLTSWLWRRSCFLGAILAARGRREWPLVLPAPVVATLAGAVCALGYAALAGFNVPAQRALWMLVVTSMAFVLGRSVAFSLVLAWAAALVSIVDPWAVTSAGFWLSFGAVAVIAFAMRTRLRARSDIEAQFDEVHAIRATDAAWVPTDEPPDGPDRSRWRRRLASVRAKCADAVRAQWAVTLGFAPLTAYWFSQVSLVGPLANAVAVPWVSVLVVPIVLVALVLPAPLDALAYEAAHALLEPLMRLLHALSQSPWADGYPPRPSLWAVVSALAGVAWCLMPRGWPLRFAAPLTWLPLVVPGAPQVEPGSFRLTALDVGQGASILIETRRRSLLFDAGTGPESSNAGARVVAPYLRANGVARLDALVVSHGDADHAAGVPAVLAAADVSQVLGGLPPDHPVWGQAQATGAERLRCAAGQRWQWDGVTFEVLWPDPGPLPARSNEQSCVLKVSASGMSALLTGDIGASSERLLVRRGPDALGADVLLVAHHGSATSSTEPFLDSVQPRIAVFQVGYRNRFRHPHPHVWSRLDERGIALARTDRDGAARVTLEAGRLTLERYRQTHARYWMDR